MASKVYKIPSGRIYHLSEMIDKGRFNINFFLQSKFGKVIDIQKEKCSIVQIKGDTNILVRLTDEDPFANLNKIFILDETGNFSSLGSCITLTYNFSQEDIRQENVVDAYKGKVYQGFWITVPEEQWEKWPDEFSIIGDLYGTEK